ncbi:centrosomal protein of 162 kDa isoform X2 [Cylas formicarius]|uniref:centrosomal protein of 162 kDa isoform X2 n=1 Tax=Cylas formicarius TaxID=197179 RepID=UPI0029585910|nr:centrosomal protein of 162 kDa isoform X2 [Cylas formicarius]
METKSPGFWWMKTPAKDVKEVSSVPTLNLKNLHSSTSVNDILEKENDENVDVGSIIEEINRVAAQSPLGPFEKSIEERSIEDIMKEAEKIYMESSKSFEQLSQRSKTSQNISDLLSSQSKGSTPTPKSISPLPIDPGESDSDYSEDFSSQDSRAESNNSSNKLLELEKLSNNMENIDGNQNMYDNKNNPSTEFQRVYAGSVDSDKSEKYSITHSKSTNLSSFVSIGNSIKKQDVSEKGTKQCSEEVHINLKEQANKQDHLVPVEQQSLEKDQQEIAKLNEEMVVKNDLIKTLEEDNKLLRGEIRSLKRELETSRSHLEKVTLELKAKTLSSPEINLELEKALEELKDAKEINTSLQLQLDTINKTHQLLKGSYDDLVVSNKTLERRVLELDTTLNKYKTELYNAQQSKDKLLENEVNLNKLLEIEKLQAKSLKLQNEKDSRCIQDLNRQIKEMERIIARKHPDSVSALIVAAKEDATDTNLTARKLLEDRIKVLEQEVVSRDSQQAKVFLEIQEKFNKMKSKYESHIEDLELHVSDLKDQLKRKADTFDIYTQTIYDEKIPQKDTFTISTQTDSAPVKTKVTASNTKKEVKEDAHLLATIRGLQADLSNKEKVISKLQKEVDEVKKTNRRLQKEREGSLRNISDRKEFRSYPERLSAQSRSNSAQDFRKGELQQLKEERDKLKQQLIRLEEDYQALKNKRLEDLTALQEAHEREISNYMLSVTPLREQLELQQVSVATLQSQLLKTKEELAMVTVDRDHLNSRLVNSTHLDSKDGVDSLEVAALLKKRNATKSENIVLELSSRV